MSDQQIILTQAQLDEALIKATEAGARRALKEIGLDDANAASDLRELRSLLSAWQEVRKSAIQAIVKFLTTVLLGAVLLGLGIKLGASNLLK